MMSLLNPTKWGCEYNTAKNSDASVVSYAQKLRVIACARHRTDRVYAWV